MIRELTDMELDAVSGGRKRHRVEKNTIVQKVDLDQKNVFVNSGTGELDQKNRANIVLVGVII
jgi:hypothetical protein